MPDSRPPIPAALERSLMIEAGYRCAVCKTTEPLQIDHIIEWSTVKKHEFENMIVLCANCHARKKNTSNARHINRASLQQIKASLMLLNGRYSDLERRIIDAFKDELSAHPGTTLCIFIPERLHLLVRYLIQDGMVEVGLYPSASSDTFEDGTTLRDDTLKLTLTRKGRQFIEHLYPH
jgi:HNH endonuclease